MIASSIHLVVLVLIVISTSSCATFAERIRQGAGADSLRETRIDRVLWARLHGAGSETLPPILRLPVEGKVSRIGSDALTLRFDMQTERVPSLTLQLVHCDRNWQPTESIFIQDAMRLQSSDFTIERSPLATSRFDYSVGITFPGTTSSIQIAYSGNYLARVIDYYDDARVLVEARFFVVEPTAQVAIGSYSDFYESLQTDVVQDGLKILVEADIDDALFGTQVKAIHLYKYGEWARPMVADENSATREYRRGRPWSRWNMYFNGRALAEFGNIPVGNEHRLLDLTDLVTYPTTGRVITTTLSDLPRNGFYIYDNNGVAVDRFVPVIDNDYVYFEFRLNLDGKQVNEDLSVIGTFNDWTPTREWRMYYDEQTGFYIARGWIKRAFHEYEYVAGTWDEDAGTLLNADATLLEGNIDNTIHPYMAFVYYRDISSGGYDRIIGAGFN